MIDTTKQQILLDAIDEFVAANITYIDAICYACEKYGFDIDMAGEIVSNNEYLKLKVQEEGENLRLIAKTPRLPC